MTTIGSLCSGYGGLDLAAEAVFGAATVWHCENEPAPSRVLAHRWPGVPNLGDLTAVDWTTVEPVDIITAGYPCQPFSHAGQRKGTDDDRHLWPHVAAAIRGIRPRHVVLENVAGHRSMGFDTVLGDLATLGYDTQWTSIRAADVGAPHGRERIFILATDTNDRRRRQHHPDKRRLPIADPRSDDGPTTADTDSAGPQGRDERGHRPDQWAPRPASVGSPADTDSGGLESVGRVDTLRRDPHRRDSPHIEWGNYQPAIRRWERLTRPAPAPTEPGPRGGQRLSPRFVEWMMGLVAGWVTDIPGLSRNDQLRMLGNGVVPQQAYAALCWLLNAAERAA